MVRTPYWPRTWEEARPTKSRSVTGRGHTLSRKFSRVMTVVASGFFRSLPSLAKTLLKDTPTEMVSPVSSRTSRRSRSAMALPSPPKRCMEPVISSQLSSMLKGSTRSVYRS